jgi:hypothetical protein
MHEIRHHALEHLAFCFECLHFLSSATFEELAAALQDVDALAELGSRHLREILARA